MVVRFSEAYHTKNKWKTPYRVQRFPIHSPWIISIPDELLLSSARFRFAMIDAKLFLKMYIYNRSNFRGGYNP